MSKDRHVDDIIANMSTAAGEAVEAIEERLRLVAQRMTVSFREAAIAMEQITMAGIRGAEAGRRFDLGWRQGMYSRLDRDDSQVPCSLVNLIADTSNPNPMLRCVVASGCVCMDFVGTGARPYRVYFDTQLPDGEENKAGYFNYREALREHARAVDELGGPA